MEPIRKLNSVAEEECAGIHHHCVPLIFFPPLFRFYFFMRLLSCCSPVECFLLCVSVFPFCLFTTFLCCCHIPCLTCSIFFFPSSLFHFTYFSFYLPFFCTALSRWHFTSTLIPSSTHCVCVCSAILQCSSTVTQATIRYHSKNASCRKLKVLVFRGACVCVGVCVCSSVHI